MYNQTFNQHVEKNNIFLNTRIEKRKNYHKYSITGTILVCSKKNHFQFSLWLCHLTHWIILGSIPLTSLNSAMLISICSKKLQMAPNKVWTCTWLVILQFQTRCTKHSARLDTDWSPERCSRFIVKETNFSKLYNSISLLFSLHSIIIYTNMNIGVQISHKKLMNFIKLNNSKDRTKDIIS